MIAETYTNRMIDKLTRVNKIYAERMYRVVSTLTDLKKIETGEHLRKPPVCTEPLSEGQTWGGEYQNMWIRTSFTVPEELKGKAIYLRPRTQAVEILLYVNDKPDGIFNIRGDYLGLHHSVQRLTECAVPGTTYELALECYAGHFCIGCSAFDNYGKTDLPHASDYIRTFEGLDICVCEQDIYDFVFDLNIVLQMATELGEDNFLRHRARAVLAELYPKLILLPNEYDEETIHASIAESSKILKPILEKSKADSTRGKISLLGHSHMDTAWLWPVSETIRKCARTYCNVIKLMRQYPEYKFIQSSALHLDWMRKYYPDIFADICEFVAQGRYEPNGGVWVECDCNITSGELMARQFLYGQLFTRQYMNYTSDSFWLPDTFGYNGAIPQIMKESGVDYFFTTKLFWNDLNKFPYSTFRWEGIDGSEVITHLHNLELTPDIKEVTKQVSVILNKQVFEQKLFAFGLGDGGGGPTPAMLEKARRITEVPGLPEINYKTASEFIAEAEEVRDELPLYTGELYLEGHRGTLTTMHDIKRTNRKAELALRDMDYFNVVAGKEKNERTDELYKVLLTNQFHDILPGTCLTGVTQLAVKENNGVIADARKIAADYAATLTEKDSTSMTVFNTLSFDRHDPILTEDNGLYPTDYPYQTFTDVTGKKILAIGGVTVPALGSLTIRLSEKKAEAPSVFTYKNGKLETPKLSVTIDEFGGFTSMIDKASRREVRREGGMPLNTFYAGQDVPLGWDNWDIETESMLCLQPQRELISMEVISDGAVLFVLRCAWKIGKHSTLTQDIMFRADSAQVDFHTLMDWHELHTFLKVGFDVDILSRTVRNEIQFGHICRNTYANTNEDMAKFEICNHKWSDLSETRFGVAILNDCKYGISVDNSNMRLTLHRGGTHPDATGDPGLHECTYSLLPHGAFSAQAVICPAYELNVPAVSVPASRAAAVFNGYLPSTETVIMEALKPAALRNDAVVARYYEAEGCKTVCTVTVPENCSAVYDVNILEDIREQIPVVDGKITLAFHPFRIRSVMFVRA